MHKYRIWARIDAYQSVNAYLWADNDWAAKQLAEAQYGAGNVLGYTRVDE
jgi:hypothetical protein